MALKITLKRAFGFEFHNGILSAVWGSSTEAYAVFISSVWIKHMIAISCTTYKLLILHERLSGIYNNMSAAEPASFQSQKSQMSAALPFKCTLRNKKQKAVPQVSSCPIDLFDNKLDVTEVLIQ